MAIPTMNPVRLLNTRLAAVGEILLDPAAELGCVPLIAHALAGADVTPPDAEACVSLVMGAVQGAVRAGLVLRVRMLDASATPEDCERAREDLLLSVARELRRAGMKPVRPLAEEGVFALMPREGMHFFCREVDRNGTPRFCTREQPIPVAALERLLLENPGSSLCLSLTPGREPQQTAFTLAWWGAAPEALSGALRLADLPFVPCGGVAPGSMLQGFELRYDPWKLHHDLTRRLGRADLTTTHIKELTALFGPPPTAQADAPAPAPLSQATRDTGVSARQMTRGLMDALPEMKQQMRTTMQLFRQGVQEQVQQSVGTALQDVQEKLRQVTLQVTDMPGLHKDVLTDTLSRMNERAERVNPGQLAEEMRTAGLARPLDALTLMKMGFGSEKELLDLGLTEDLLALLRSTVQLHAQSPSMCGDDVNCMPYAFMIGYMYEALISHCFVPLFRATGGYRKAHHLADFTRVNWDHCQRLADFPGYHHSGMRSLTPQDWASWLTLCNAMRSLRNRQHSDRTTGFISHAEMEAAYDMFLFPGQLAKVTLLHLPAFSPAPPAWAKLFQPDLPADWAGGTPEEQRRTVERHIVSRVSPFTPSLLQFLLRCRCITPEEDC